MLSRSTPDLDIIEEVAHRMISMTGVAHAPAGETYASMLSLGYSIGFADAHCELNMSSRSSPTLEVELTIVKGAFVSFSTLPFVSNRIGENTTASSTATMRVVLCTP